MNVEPVLIMKLLPKQERREQKESITVERKTPMKHDDRWLTGDWQVRSRLLSQITQSLAAQRHLQAEEQLQRHAAVAVLLYIDVSSSYFAKTWGWWFFITDWLGLYFNRLNSCLISLVVFVFFFFPKICMVSWFPLPSWWKCGFTFYLIILSLHPCYILKRCCLRWFTTGPPEARTFLVLVWAW